MRRGMKCAMFLNRSTIVRMVECRGFLVSYRTCFDVLMDILLHRWPPEEMLQETADMLNIRPRAKGNRHTQTFRQAGKVCFQWVPIFCPSSPR